MGDGFFAQSEGAFFASKNILTERDPEKITFETLPDGDIGLRTPAGGGRVAEEQSIVKLSDGSLYCVYRTVDGWPACAYSRDGGHTWTAPAYKTYTPGGRRVKHPRAANFAWNCSNGKFLYWFHNHGGRFVGELGAAGKDGRSPYDDRNPAWLMAGREVRHAAGQAHRMVAAGDPALRRRPVHPHELPRPRRGRRQVLRHRDAEEHRPRPRNPAAAARRPVRPVGQPHRRHSRAWCSTCRPASRCPPKRRCRSCPSCNSRDTKRADHGGKDLRAGFSLDLWLQLDSLARRPGHPRQPRRDRRRASSSRRPRPARSRITLNDGRQEVELGQRPRRRSRPASATTSSSPWTAARRSSPSSWTACSATAATQRQFGWGRFSPTLRTPNGAATLKIAPVRARRCASTTAPCAPARPSAISAPGYDPAVGQALPQRYMKPTG